MTSKSIAFFSKVLSLKTQNHTQTILQQNLFYLVYNDDYSDIVQNVERIDVSEMNEEDLRKIYNFDRTVILTGIYDFEIE